MIAIASLHITLQQLQSIQTRTLSYPLSQVHLDLDLAQHPQQRNSHLQVRAITLAMEAEKEVKSMGLLPQQ